MAVFIAVLASPAPEANPLAKPRAQPHIVVASPIAYSSEPILTSSRYYAGHHYDSLELSAPYVAYDAYPHAYSHFHQHHDGYVSTSHIH